VGWEVLGERSHSWLFFIGVSFSTKSSPTVRKTKCFSESVIIFVSILSFQRINCFQRKEQFGLFVFVVIFMDLNLVIFKIAEEEIELLLREDEEIVDRSMEDIEKVLEEDIPEWESQAQRSVFALQEEQVVARGKIPPGVNLSTKTQEPFPMGEQISSEEDWDDNCSSEKILHPTEDPIESEEDWSGIEEIRTTEPERRKKTRGEVVEFWTGTNKAYRSMVMRDWWSYMERELRLTNCDREEFSGQEMPKFTAETLRIMLANNFNYSPKPRFLLLGRSLDAGERVIVQDFVDYARKSRLISINTEGCQETRKRKSGEETPLVMVSLSNLNGRILFFEDAVEMPKAVRDLLTDVSVTKLGSGLGREGEELERIGIKMRGWVCSGSLYRAFCQKEAKTGIEAQCRFLTSFCPPTRFPYIKYDWHWAKDLRLGAWGKIPSDCWQHVCMNVQVPLAIVCAAALKFVEDRKLPDSTLVFPIMWEGLDLVRMKVPEELVNISEDPQENWVAHKPDGFVYSRHQRLNDCRELTFLRRAQADFVEVYEPFYNPGAQAAEAYEMYLDPRGRRWYLPLKKIAKGGAVPGFLAGHCATCGSPYHSNRRCDRTETIRACDYEHDDARDLQPHTALACPVLHNYCGECFMRGHDPSAHEKRTATQRELRQRFLAQQPHGLRTSVLLLAHRPGGKERMISSHWRFGLLGQSFRRDAVSRFHLRLRRDVQLGFNKARIRREGEERSEALQEKIDLVQFNASLENPLVAVSIPRFIVNESARKRALEKRQEKPPEKRSVWERLGPKKCRGENSPTGRFGEEAEAGYVIYETDESDESIEEVWIDEETLTIIPH